MLVSMRVGIFHEGIERLLVKIKLCTGWNPPNCAYDVPEYWDPVKERIKKAISNTSVDYILGHKRSHEGGGLISQIVNNGIQLLNVCPSIFCQF